jgi:nitrogen regulatory protein PII
MSFVEQIQQWVSIDNQMKQLTDKLKELKDKKNDLNESIFGHDDLTKTTIQLNDGKLKFIQTKDTQQLTFKYLETCLHEIIKNEEQVDKIVEYIKNKRDVKFVSEIKRFYNK